MVTRFRFGVSAINVHHLRYKTFNQNQLFCPFCKTLEENELHFVLYCPMYNTLRERYIPQKFCRNPTMQKLSLLLSSRHSETAENLSRFIYYALKKRDTAVS